MKWRVPVGEWSDRAAFILGGGPSLAEVDVDAIRGRGAVIAVNNAGFDLAPWADVLFFADGQSRWYGWNRDRLPEFKGSLIVTRAVVPEGDPRLRQVKFLPREPLSRDPVGLAGHCGGSSAINLAYLMGARVIVLLGFDMRPGNWHDKHRLPTLPGWHRDRFIPAIERMAPQLAADGCLVLNATKGSALRCFPSVDLQELLALDDIARAEAEKYTRIWERPEYRRLSPGMLECERALAVCEMQRGESLTDFGAGTCRATEWFQGQGISALAVDHVDNARETSVPFVNACLWDMADRLAVTDWGFCCDVMEHIPPEKVGSVLDQIRALTMRGTYFRIATRPDQMGRLIGKTLHLTVRGAEWWRRQIEARWLTVDVIEKTDRDLIVMARP